MVRRICPMLKKFETMTSPRINKNIIRRKATMVFLLLLNIVLSELFCTMLIAVCIFNSTHISHSPLTLPFYLSENMPLNLQLRQ